MYTRGQFTVIGKTTLKALRIYEEMGLLSPSYIDSKNQYKYYSADQINEILFINELKAYGFALESIKEIKESSNSNYVITHLQRRLSELEAEIRENARIKDDLAKKINELSTPSTRSSSPSPYNVELVSWNDQHVVGLQEKNNLQNAGNLIGRVYEMISRYALQAVDSHFIIFHTNEREDESQELDLEVCVPVTQAFQTDTFSTKLIPGMTYARTIHTGGFSNVGKAHAAVIDWVHEQKLILAGYPIEKYNLSRPSMGSFEIEVMYPIQKAE